LGTPGRQYHGRFPDCPGARGQTPVPSSRGPAGGAPNCSAVLSSQGRGSGLVALTQGRGRGRT
jgi:hypothetical protein